MRLKSSTRESPAVRQDWTGAQYTFFRGLLGAYLFVHFVHLLPWGAECSSYSNEYRFTEGICSKSQ